MANQSLIPAVGDVVTLISGGPPMTVEELKNAPIPPAGLPAGASPLLLVHCVWFNSDGNFAHADFSAAVLAASGSTPPPAKSGSSSTLNK